MKNNPLFRLRPDMFAQCALLLATIAVFLASMAVWSEWGVTVRALASLAHAQGFYLVVFSFYPSLVPRQRPVYVAMGLASMLLPHIMH